MKLYRHAQRPVAEGLELYLVPHPTVQLSDLFERHLTRQHDAMCSHARIGERGRRIGD